MDKTIVLDTSVILYDHSIMHDIESETQIVVPMSVLKEIDRHKGDSSAAGYNARAFVREIDTLRHNGNILDGVPVNGNGVKFRVENHYKPEIATDDDLIELCKRLSEKHDDVTLVSEDISLRIMANGHNIKSVSCLEIYNCEPFTGIREIKVSKKDLDNYFETKNLSYYDTVNPNEYFIMKCGNQSGLGKYDQDKGCIVPIKNTKLESLKPKNAHQKFLIDSITDTKVKLVTAQSKAGCGKTIVSLAIALHLIRHEHLYEKLIITKAVIPVGGQDRIGFLPGSFDEKLKYWTYNFSDNLSLISQTDNIFDSKDIEVCSTMHMRGRSLLNSLIILDEAQNISPKEMKTILTRVGENSKIICLGDVSQIDVPYLNEYNCGLTYISNKFKSYVLSAAVTLFRNERSELADIAAEIL